MKLIWCLIFILTLLAVGIQVAIFYQGHPESIGPHSIPLATPALSTFPYLLPFVALLVGSALLRKKERGRVFALFFQFIWLLTPVVSLVKSRHLPRDIRIEQTLQIALFALTIFLTVRTIPGPTVRKIVGVSSSLALLYVLIALRF